MFLCSLVADWVDWTYFHRILIFFLICIDEIFFGQHPLYCSLTNFTVLPYFSGTKSRVYSYFCIYVNFFISTKCWLTRSCGIWNTTCCFKLLKNLLQISLRYREISLIRHSAAWTLFPHWPIINTAAILSATVRTILLM